MKDNVVERFEKGINNIELLDTKKKFQAKDKIILEWGTGWHGIDIIIFFLLGVQKIITIDQHQYLKLGNFL